MKNYIKLLLLCSLLFLLPTILKAQNSERFTITMTINNSGKNIISQLSTVNYGISRYTDPATQPETATKTDSKDKTEAVDKAKVVDRGYYYLSIMVKEVGTDLLKLFSKKDTKFSGSITVTDNYGKNNPKEIKFISASLESYSDQFNATTYDDGYPTASVSFSCKGLTINGVVLE